MQSLASRLRMARGKMSAKDFAKKLEKNSQTVYRYEWAERTPDEDYLQRVAALTGYSLEWLMHGGGKKAGTGTILENRPFLYQNCPNCLEYIEKIEKKLEIVEEERRELSQENRQLHKDKELLMLENADLKEKIGKLESYKFLNSGIHSTGSSGVA